MDARHVAGVDYGGAVRLWELHTRQKVRGFSDNVGGHVLALSEYHVVAGGDDGAFVWDRCTGALRHRLHEGERVTAIAALDDLLAIATEPFSRTHREAVDATIHLWHAITGEKLQELHGHTRGITCLDLTDGMLTSAGWDSTLRVWQAGAA